MACGLRRGPAPAGGGDGVLVAAIEQVEHAFEGIERPSVRAIEEELELRHNNPALRAAAGESLARVFLQLARHRLPGATFDSLLQEALAACGPEGVAEAASEPARSLSHTSAMPVVLTPEPLAAAV